MYIVEGLFYEKKKYRDAGFNRFVLRLAVNGVRAGRWNE
jgi:hypothetical protein